MGSFSLYGYIYIKTKDERFDKRETRRGDN